MTSSMTPDSAAAFFSMTKNPVKFRMFQLQQLPASYFSGVRIISADSEKAEVSVPYKWFTRNPFRSTYFACLSMAAEMSTGVLALAQVYKRQPAVALLVVAVEGKFYKKAIAKTKFICLEGKAISTTVQTAIDTGEPQTIRALSSGYNDAGELVAEFWITWSFRRRV
jgi:hypothetical protein